MQRKLLFIAYYFPPARAIASVRTLAMAKYLARAGWQVTVLTPRPGLWQELEDPQEIEALLVRAGITRVHTGHTLRFLQPEYLKCWNSGIGHLVGGTSRKIARAAGLEAEWGWLPYAIWESRRFEPGDFDLVLASGGPFLTFGLAKKVAERLKCRFVVDYRDPWNGNPHRGAEVSKRAVNLEEKVLNSCAAATVVSPSWAQHISQAFHLQSKPIVISNGFDAEELDRVKPARFDHFAIVYAGNFYPPDRVITPLLRALHILKNQHISIPCSWRFHYYGSWETHVREQATQWGLLDSITFHGSVPRAESLSAIRGANVAVVITSVGAHASPEQRGIVTGKIFEPVGLGTPVLLIAPENSDASDVVEATAAGAHFTADDTAAMATFLLDSMAGASPKPRIPKEYSWESIAGEMDRTLRNALEF